MGIPVKDFMSTPVAAARGEDNVLEIRTLMKEKGIYAIPIISYANESISVLKH